MRVGRGLTIVNVAYPLAAVRPETAGGAEQVLAALDAGLASRGHRSLVVAPEGSRCRGELVATPAPAGPLGPRALETAHREHRRVLDGLLRAEHVDVVHLHGLDFASYLPWGEVPALATLHLPPAWYPAEAFRPRRPHTFLSCVSWNQLSRCPDSPSLVGAIPNGVATERLRFASRGGHGIVALGRICPEKGFDVALEAARAAGLEMTLAGQVHPYPDHQRYFETEIRPRLDRARRFAGPVGGARKHQLLASARCLAVPSRVAETSCLVAMEAMSCGTPVVARPIGALPEIVEDGVTGLLVDDPRDFPDAFRAAAALDRRACRLVAEARFSVEGMVRRYLRLYRAVAGARA